MMQDIQQWSSHQKRWVTGLSLVLPIFLAISFGPFWSWYLVVSLFAALGLWEFHGMLFGEGLPVRWQAFFIAVGLFFPTGAVVAGAAGLQCALVGAIFCGLLSLLLFSPLDAGGIQRVSLFTLGWIYIPFFLSHILLFWRVEHARAWIYFVILIIAAGDIGAYYGGRRWGAHKLYELVSPNKTVEGALGGLLSSAAVGVVFGLLFLGHIPVAKLAFGSMALGMVGQIGDLFESMIKRVSGKKDSSQLLPGHGGVLDRLDSLFFVFPATWFLLKWVVD